jgi:hypothetical protein
MRIGEPPRGIDSRAAEIGAIAVDLGEEQPAKGGMSDLDRGLRPVFFTVPPVTMTVTPGCVSREMAMSRLLVMTTTSRRSAGSASAIASVVVPASRMIVSPWRTIRAAIAPMRSFSLGEALARQFERAHETRRLH